MLVLGIVGSPRKEGRTSALIDAALQGAADAGADVRKLYLIEHDIKPFSSQGGAAEGVQFLPTTLCDVCEQADALVLGAPVYFGDINGLSKDFMDSVRIRNENGKPALGIAVAGGSGKGLLSGVQSLYHWFYHRQMRAIDPTPVTRFNEEIVLAALPASGARLVEMAKNPQPFPGAGREDRWAEIVAYYAGIPYLDKDPVDEFLMLAEQLITISAGHAALDEAKDAYAQALDLAQQGDRANAGRRAVRAYELLLH
jgi:multimeric flavodoxin WrbA